MKLPSVLYAMKSARGSCLRLASGVPLIPSTHKTRCVGRTLRPTDITRRVPCDHAPMARAGVVYPGLAPLHWRPASGAKALWKAIHHPTTALSQVLRARSPLKLSERKLRLSARERARSRRGPAVLWPPACLVLWLARAMGNLGSCLVSCRLVRVQAVLARPVFRRGSW